MKRLTTIFFLLFFSVIGHAQSKVTVGAYYFDGWTKLNNNQHLTKSLIQDYSARKPVWGWVTSSQSIVDAQINSAADAGLSFFSFCWYFDAKKNVDSMNRALVYYDKSPFKKRLKFCLMVANHTGSIIGPKEWPMVVTEWVKQFKSGNYLTVNKKPLLTFLLVNSLVKSFGSEENVHKAFDSLRMVARRAGLNGVSIAACLGPGRGETSAAENCGFDVLTGYNYSPVGFISGQQQAPIDNMRIKEAHIWSLFQRASDLPYIPLSTLNWDPRPWASSANRYASLPYFVGYSPRSVYASVKSVMDWIRANPTHVTTERIAILYAWNEYGEGAYLTPTDRDSISPYVGLKRALSENR